MQNFLNKSIQNTNFKKIFTGFIILAIVIVMGLLATGGYLYRDKISFAYKYNRIQDKYERRFNDSLKQDLSNIATNSKDIVDILVLDKDNNITYSTNNTSLVWNQIFDLDYFNMNHKYLVNKNQEDILFSLKDDEDFYLTIFLNGKSDKFREKYDDEEKIVITNMRNKKIYNLSIISNKKTSEKVYFITDIKPVKNVGLYIEIVEVILITLLTTYLIIVALWTYQNARRNYLNAPLWGMIALFTNIIGVIIYEIYKRNIIVCDECHLIQNKNNIFCTNCQKQLNEYCKNCHNKLEKTDKYCSHCGTENASNK